MSDLDAVMAAAADERLGEAGEVVVAAVRQVVDDVAGDDDELRDELRGRMVSALLADYERTVLTEALTVYADLMVDEDGTVMGGSPESARVQVANDLMDRLGLIASRSGE